MRLSEFSSKIAHALLHRDKTTDRPRGRPLKRRSLDVRTEQRGKWAPLSQDDFRFDDIGHWSERFSNEGKCRHCKMTCRVMCKKCSKSVLKVFYTMENSPMFG